MPDHWKQWPKFKKFAVFLGILLSLGSIHYVTFVFGIPRELHSLLDAQFKANFFASLLLIATFSVVCARYLPLFIVAFVTFVVTNSIEHEYWKRGYRRVAVAHGRFREGRMWDSALREKYELELQRFGRNNARLDNFMSNKVQSLPFVRIYERKKLEFSIFGSVLVFLLFYLKFLPAGSLVALGSIIFGILSNYQRYNDDFRFSLFGYKFSGDDPEHKPSENSWNLDDAVLAAITCALIFAAAGPMRLQLALESEGVNFDLKGEQVSGQIIGTTGHGILFFTNRFGFAPFTEITTR